MNDNWMEPKKILNKIGFALFFMALAVLASSALIEVVVYYAAPELWDTDWFNWVATAITVMGIGLPVFYLTGRGVPKPEKKEVVKLGGAKFIVIFFICTAAMYLTNYLGVFINFLISLIKGEDILNPLMDAVLEGNILLTFLYGAIVGPIVEEIIFRKLLLDRVRRFGDLPAILITGIAFGLFHMNLSQFFYATTLGFIFAYVTLKTNTIRYSILLHIMINSIGVLVAPMVLKAENLLLMMAMGLWVISAISVGTVFFCLNVKKIKFEKTQVPVAKKSDYFLNTGTILFIVLCLIMTVRLILM
jgi:membrane protease YdiL (CAAX protease family)